MDSVRSRETWKDGRGKCLAGAKAGFAGFRGWFLGASQGDHLAKSSAGSGLRGWQREQPSNPYVQLQKKRLGGFRSRGLIHEQLLMGRRLGPEQPQPGHLVEDVLC